MARKSTATPSTLVDELVARTRLSWLQVSIAVGLVLVLLLGGALHLDGVPGRPFHRYSWSDWWHQVREEVDHPVIIVYILVTYHLLRGPHRRAIGALRALAATDDDSGCLAAETTTFDRRREWLALGIGAAFGLLVRGPGNMPAHFFWRKLFLFLSAPLTFALLGWIIYVSLASSRQFAELHRQSLNIDVFDPTPLEPIARWSLGISLVFIGGITLSVLLNPTTEEFFSTEGIIVYGTLILVSVVLFFLTMASTHRVMSDVKKQKLKLVRRNLSATFQELQERAADGQLQDMEALSDSITAWLAYEKRLEESPEWPYTTDTVRNLLMSTLLPVAAWGAQIIVELIT